MVRQCVPIPQKTYNKTKRLKTPEEVEKYFPGLLAFIDFTEQQIPRPVDKNRRKIFYSGKKKRILSRIIYGYIIHKAAHKKGRKHDYYIQYTRITIL